MLLPRRCRPAAHRLVQERTDGTERTAIRIDPPPIA